MSVLAWPSYLLNGIPLELRDAMSEEAEREQMSLADVVRSCLCAHYGLDCDLRSVAYSGERDTGSSSMLLRLQPDVFGALGKQSVRQKRTMREIVLEILERHYGMEP